MAWDSRMVSAMVQIQSWQPGINVRESYLSDAILIGCMWECQETIHTTNSRYQIGFIYTLETPLSSEPV
jgi:hypothetical protein